MLRVIRPDSVAEPDNLRFKIGILKAGDSGTGAFRAAQLESFTGNGSLADPAVFTLPLSAFGDGVEYAQVGTGRWRAAAVCGRQAGWRSCPGLQRWVLVPQQPAWAPLLAASACSPIPCVDPAWQARFVAVAVNATGGFDNPSDASAMVTVGAWGSSGL